MSATREKVKKGTKFMCGNRKLKYDRGSLLFFITASLQNLHRSLVSSNLPSRGRVMSLQLINGKNREEAIL